MYRERCDIYTFHYIYVLYVATVFSSCVAPITAASLEEVKIYDISYVYVYIYDIIYIYMYRERERENI